MLNKKLNFTFPQIHIQMINRTAAFSKSISRVLELSESEGELNELIVFIVKCSHDKGYSLVYSSACKLRSRPQCFVMLFFSHLSTLLLYSKFLFRSINVIYFWVRTYLNNNLE